jgi:hypothetical protein
VKDRLRENSSIGHESRRINGNGLSENHTYYDLVGFCPNNFPGSVSITRWMSGYTKNVEAKVSYTGVKPVAIVEVAGDLGEEGIKPECDSC